MALTRTPYRESQDAANLLLANRSGFTLIRGSNEPLNVNRGYLVGGATRHENLLFDPRSTLESIMADRIARWIDALPRTGTVQYLGIWTDTVTGYIHLDVSSWHESRVEAEAVGIARKQIAIWDCKNGSEVRL